MERTPEGGVAVDDHLETSIEGVFAAGDAIRPFFVYAAAYEGALAAENALAARRRPRDYTGLPWVIFTDPQVGGGELVAEASLAIKHGIPVAELAAAFHPYLTLAEGVRLAALQFRKDVNKLSCCAG